MKRDGRTLDHATLETIRSAQRVLEGESSPQRWSPPSGSTAQRSISGSLRRPSQVSDCARCKPVESGASIGLSRTRTSRGLSSLEQLGFLVETDAADPQHGRPRRWRLTMYPAGGKPATKDFMRPKPALENSFHGCSGATDLAVSAALVQPNKMAAEQSAGDLALKFTQNALPAKALTAASFSSA